MRTKRIVGVVAGNENEDEHQNSIKDGLKIVQAIIDFGKLDACLIEITQEGPWKLHKGTDVAEVDKLMFYAKIDGIRVKPEVVLIQAKGKVGESGELQEYFDNMQIPFSNSGVFQARTTFNKFECGSVLRSAGLPVVRSLLVKQEEDIDEDFTGRVTKLIGMPCFVKPNKSGDAQGITKVSESVELSAAVETARRFDNEVIIESAIIQGTEVTCTVHDVTVDDMLEALPVTEITHSGEYFHSCHPQPNTEISTPTKTLRGEVAAEIIKIAKLAYRTLKLTGIASIDMIVQDELPIIIEVNSVPSIAPNSLVERQVKAGLSIQWQRNMGKFYNVLIEHASNTFPLISMNPVYEEENTEVSESEEDMTDVSGDISE